MNRARDLIGVSTTALISTLLLVAGATQAYGRPAPVQDDVQAPPAPPISQPADGIAAWQVATIAVACAVLAVLVTLLVVRLIDRRRRVPQPVAT
jgi:hypothetical protein